MTTTEKTREEQFVERIEKLDSGELAMLRRGCGERDPVEGRCPWLIRHIYGAAPEPVAFLVASLLAQYKTSDIKACRHRIKGNFGTTWERAIAGANSKSLPRRFRILLDAEYDPWTGEGDLPYWLRQMVRYAASYGATYGYYYLKAKAKMRAAVGASRQADGGGPCFAAADGGYAGVWPFGDSVLYIPPGTRQEDVAIKVLGEPVADWVVDRMTGLPIDPADVGYKMVNAASSVAAYYSYAVPLIDGLHPLSLSEAIDLFQAQGPLDYKAWLGYADPTLAGKWVYFEGAAWQRADIGNALYGNLMSMAGYPSRTIRLGAGGQSAWSYTRGLLGRNWKSFRKMLSWYETIFDDPRDQYFIQVGIERSHGR